MSYARKDRIKVELMVQKSLMGYKHSHLGEYYVAVVGSGVLLGKGNPNMAPRCEKVGNTLWRKEIWLPKSSCLAFRFLIVKAATHEVAELEVVPERHVRLGNKHVVIQTRFNDNTFIKGQGIEILDVRHQRNCKLQQKAETEAKRVNRDSHEVIQTKKKQDIYCEETLPEDIRAVIKAMDECTRKELSQKIDKAVTFQEIQTKVPCMRRFKIAIDKTCLSQLGLNIGHISQAFNEFGLNASINQEAPGGKHELEIWLRNKEDKQNFCNRVAPENVEDTVVSVEEMGDVEQLIKNEESEIHKEETNTKTRCGWFPSYKKFLLYSGIAIATCVGAYVFQKG